MRKTHLVLILVVILLYSCFSPRYVYSPSATNVPFLKEKGDSKMGFNYSTNLVGIKAGDGTILHDKRRGTDLHGAYAFTDHLALQVNYFSRKENTETLSFSDSGSVDYKRSLFEIGAGFYKYGDSKKHNMLQVFGGFGFGKTSFADIGIDNNNAKYNYSFEADITKIFLQPAIIFSSHKLFTVSVSSRFSYVRFRNIRSNYDSAQLSNHMLVDIQSDPAIFWEPAFINSIGFRKLPGIRLEYQLGFSSLINNPRMYRRKNNFSVGFFVDLPKLLRSTS